jgi:hypothetical protein
VDIAFVEVDITFVEVDVAFLESGYYFCFCRGRIDIAFAEGVLS